jgi:TonB family protein
VRTPFPRRGVADSLCAHAALLGLLYAVSIWPAATAHLERPLSRRVRESYIVSPYLPELHGLPTHSRAGRKPDPVLAKQEILSLPKAPDNLHQTIVSPPKIKLLKDVDLPNIVAYQPVAPVQPLAASARELASLRLPDLAPKVVGPAADTSSLGSRQRLPAWQPLVAEAAPAVTEAHPRLVLPAFQPKVVEPAPDTGFGGRRNTASLAQLAPRVAPPMPEMQQMGDGQRSTAQIIALNLHPAEAYAPVELPSGNRSGAFAASPGGRTEASGTPGAETGAASGTGESRSPVNAPAGIHVGGAAQPAAAVAAPNAPDHPNGPARNPAPGDADVRARLMAAMRTPPIASIPPHQPIARENSASRSALENRIFGGRRSYTLSVNMPNLNTATGSWIIHFVERNPGAAHSPIAAPEVVSKFDPAYPAEVMKDGVQGTVILTAIIRSDGSVGNIAVAKSLDPRLDHNAVEALSHWLFRPALKDGQAIDLEAVITVPFRLKGVGLR